MQFIKKGELPPKDWDDWFMTANNRRTHDYSDYQSLPNLHLAKEYLLKEQYELCAYCQTKLISEHTSIEHVIPKSYNKEVSTNYYNLVVVCKNPIKDPYTGKSHCDKERGNELLSPLIFYNNAQVTRKVNHAWFDVAQDGSVFSKATLKDEIKKQVDSFIEITNLNHSVLKQKRSKDTLKGILDIFRNIPDYQKRGFWESQFERISSNESHPYRQYLLIYIANKIGIR